MVNINEAKFFNSFNVQKFGAIKMAVSLKNKNLMNCFV